MSVLPSYDRHLDTWEKRRKQMRLWQKVVSSGEGWEMSKHTVRREEGRTDQSLKSSVVTLGGDELTEHPVNRKCSQLTFFIEDPTHSDRHLLDLTHYLIRWSVSVSNNVCQKILLHIQNNIQSPTLKFQLFPCLYQRQHVSLDLVFAFPMVSAFFTFFFFYSFKY